MADRRRTYSRTQTTTALLEREDLRTQPRVSPRRYPETPSRETPTGLQPRPHRSTRKNPPAAPKRLGSRQVVSRRGRRIQPRKETPRILKISAAALLFAIAGIIGAMTLSGVTTQQTFQLQQLKVEQNRLDNQLESLNRDLENVRSSASLARQAGERHLVVPQQPGILAVNDEGEVTEVRPPSEETRPIIDVNGKPVRAHIASSNPEKTRELDGNVSAVPHLGMPNNDAGVAPYAPNVPAAPSPGR